MFALKLNGETTRSPSRLPQRTQISTSLDISLPGRDSRREDTAWRGHTTKMPPDKSVNIFGESVCMGAKDAGERTLTPSIRLQPSRIVGILSAIAMLLVVISVAGPLVRYVGGHDSVYGLLPPAERLFHLNREQNVQPCFPCFSCSVLPLFSG